MTLLVDHLDEPRRNPIYYELSRQVYRDRSFEKRETYKKEAQYETHMQQISTFLQSYTTSKSWCRGGWPRLYTSFCLERLASSIWSLTFRSRSWDHSAQIALFKRVIDDHAERSINGIGRHDDLARDIVCVEHMGWYNGAGRKLCRSWAGRELNAGKAHAFCSHSILFGLQFSWTHTEDLLLTG